MSLPPPVDPRLPNGIASARSGPIGQNATNDGNRAALNANREPPVHINFVHTTNTQAPPPPMTAQMPERPPISLENLWRGGASPGAPSHLTMSS